MPKISELNWQTVGCCDGHQAATIDTADGAHVAVQRTVGSDAYAVIVMRGGIATKVVRDLTAAQAQTELDGLAA